MIIGLYFAAAIVLIYCIYICFIALKVTPDISINEPIVNQKISIIIPCRNESKNIGLSLKSISLQSYPKSNIEVIVVNDYSEDNTVTEALKYKDIVNLIILENKEAGKKGALTLGIQKAQNNIIITTDADCVFHRDWVLSMVNDFEENQLNMLCGPIEFKALNSIFTKLQQAESAAIVGISAAMLNAQMPATCNGANLIFNKLIFEQIGGYTSHQNIATGDDDLLMHTFYKLDNKKVKYTMNKNAMVTASANMSFTEFLKQRSRWLAKRSFYIFKYNQYLQLLIFFHLMSFYLLIIWCVFSFNYLALLCIVLKYGIDILYGLKLKQIFNFKLSLILWMPFYQLYVFRVSLYAKFNTIEWKGRLVQNK